MYLGIVLLATPYSMLNMLEKLWLWLSNRIEIQVPDSKNVWTATSVLFASTVLFLLLKLLMKVSQQRGRTNVINKYVCGTEPTVLIDEVYGSTGVTTGVTPQSNDCPPPIASTNEVTTFSGFSEGIELNLDTTQVARKTYDTLAVIPFHYSFHDNTEIISPSSSELDVNVLLAMVHYTAAMSHIPENMESCIQLLKMKLQLMNVPRGNSGLTPFLSACLAGSITLVRFMLYHGADVRCRTYDGDTALHLAVRYLLTETKSKRRMNLLHLLVNAGVSVNTFNQSGFTPLHLVASKGCERTVRWLLSNGAVAVLRSKNGLRAIDLAYQAGHAKTVQILSKTKGRILGIPGSSTAPYVLPLPASHRHRDSSNNRSMDQMLMEYDSDFSMREP